MSTANFIYQNDFELWAADFSLPIYPEDENGDPDETAAPIDYDFDDYAYSEAQNKIDELNKSLKFFKLQLEPGYYAGVQIVIDDNNCPDGWYFERYFDFADYGVNRYVLRRMVEAEKRRINNELLPGFRAYGFEHYGISARFSNGETWYSRIA